MHSSVVSKGSLTLAGRLARTSLLVFFSLLVFVYLISSFHATPTQYNGPTSHRRPEEAPRIVKLSMCYGKPNILYERALRSHARHDERWNYDMRVLRHDVTGGYWNKPSFVLSQVVQELAKDPEERAEWIMWVDADLILINPSVPLSIFLPPNDLEHIHFLGSRDQNGLNTGTFFLRVNEWAVKFLTKSMGIPMFRPNLDLGFQEDQTAMSFVANESEFAPNIVFQPRVWYNTYEFHHDYEGQPGHLLVHFPGLEEDRWRHMDMWLSRVESYEMHKWDVPLEDTFYPANVTRWWSEMREAYKQAWEGEKFFIQQDEELKGLDDTQANEKKSQRPKELVDASDHLRVQLNSLKEAIWFAADYEENLVEGRKAVEERLEFANRIKGGDRPA